MSLQEALSPSAARVSSHSAKSRYVILTIICVLYFISYLDRVAISVTAPKMIAEFHFSKATMGLVFSAFAYTYAFLQIVGGMLGDRFGPRAVLAGLMSWWSAFTILTGAAGSLATLIVARLLFGAGEAGGFPVATRALSSWFSKENNGFLQGMLHACSRSGAAFAPPIVVAIVAWSGNWRTAFYLLGSIGFAWSIWFYTYYRSNPQSSTAPDPSRQRIAIPWKQIFTSSDVWLLTFTYFTYGYTLWIYLTWLPTYLQEQRHFSFTQLGVAASLPLVGGVIGDLVGGTLSDLIYRKTGNLNLARRSVIAASFLGTVAFVSPSLAVHNANMSVLLSAGALFMLECAVSNCWAVAMDLGGKQFSGTVCGFMNTGFGVAGFVSPFVFGILVDRTGSWTPGFIVGSALLIIGAITIFFVNATRTVNKPL